MLDIIGSKVKEVHLRLAGIPIVALILALTEQDEDHTFLVKFFISLGFTAFYWNGAFLIFLYFRRKFPYIRQTPRRIFLMLLTLVVFLGVGDILGCVVVNGKSPGELFAAGDLFDYIPLTFTTTFIIGSIYENFYFFDQWRNTVRVNDALKNQQIRTQFEVLQNQMSPHFLFNSLNTLTALIAENPQVAMEFTQKLSEVYRYILQNKERELVRLEEEVEFAEAYLYLLRMRYPHNLYTDFNIPHEHLSRNIAPLTLQMLVENAIKHNVVSRAHPLTIKIYTENDRLIVSNNLQVKNSFDRSTKTGLMNIRRRYEFLSNRTIDVLTTDEHFVVAVPMIDIREEKDLNSVLAG